MKAREANLVCWDFEGCGNWPLQVAVDSMKALEIDPEFFSNLYAPPDLEIPSIDPCLPAGCSRAESCAPAAGAVATTACVFPVRQLRGPAYSVPETAAV